MITDRKSLNEALAKQRIILLDEITEYRIDEIMYRLVALSLESNKEISMIINSDGGDVDPGLRLYDLLKFMETPVTGVVIGKCHSTALIILQACQKRLATRHSSFLCHFVRSSVTFPVNNGFEQKLKSEVKKARADQKYFEEILSERTKLSQAEIVKLMQEGERDGDISAKRALQLGFLDEIVEQYEDREVPEEK